MSHNNKECLYVEQLVDWINKSSHLKLLKTVEFLSSSVFEDKTCLPFFLQHHDKPIQIWSGTVKESVSTFTIQLFECNAGPIEVLVNNQPVATIQQGSSYSMTYHRLESIKLRCRHTIEHGTIHCTGDLRVVTKYRDPDSPHTAHFEPVDCYLSDQNGHKHNDVSKAAPICKELSDPKKRAEKHILFEGKNTKVNEVDLIIKGYVTVVFYSEETDECKYCTYPFNVIEKVLLCAPKGTTVDCTLKSYTCKTYVIDQDNCPSKKHSCLTIAILIELLLNIEVKKQVAICLPAKRIQPRSENHD